MEDSLLQDSQVAVPNSKILACSWASTSTDSATTRITTTTISIQQPPPTESDEYPALPAHMVRMINQGKCWTRDSSTRYARRRHLSESSNPVRSCPILSHPVRSGFLFHFLRIFLPHRRILYSKGMTWDSKGLPRFLPHDIPLTPFFLVKSGPKCPEDTLSLPLGSRKRVLPFNARFGLEDVH